MSIPSDDVHEHIFQPCNFWCEDCGESLETCRECDTYSIHTCADKNQSVRPLPKQFKQIPEFPEYMVTRSGKIRKIANNQRAFFERITSTGTVLILLYKDGQPYVRGLEDLIKQAYDEVR